MKRAALVLPVLAALVFLQIGALLVTPASARPSVSRAAPADRREQARLYGVSVRDVRARCVRVSGTRARCDTRVCDRWIVGAPAMWASFTNRVTFRGGRWHIGYWDHNAVIGDAC